MKKNKMMRAASALLVAVLLTTCAVSGTFAKYVTTNEGADSARVAKWGVVIDVKDDMDAFKTSYDETTNGITVNNVTDDKNLVAPGTNGSMSFSITGTPEVAVKLSVECTDTQVIHLDAGTYTLEANKFADTATTVATTVDYEPIKFYFGEAAITDATVYDKTLAELQTALNALSKTKLDPNTTLDKTYYIGWKWAFDNTITGTFDGGAPYSGATVGDFLDTYLGDESTLQTEAFKLKITVEQID